MLALDDFGKAFVANRDACTGCTQCEILCPDFAIEVEVSGPGFSLKMENLGYAALCEIPCVVVNVPVGGRG